MDRGRLYVHNNGSIMHSLFLFPKLFADEAGSPLRTKLDLVVMSICDVFNKVTSRSYDTALINRTVNE